MTHTPFWEGPTPSFLNRFEQAFRTLSTKNSGKVLENRNSTIGASEINGCPRKVVLSKLEGQPAHSFQTLSRFFRGHRQEEFNAPTHRQVAIEDGICWIPQLRVTHPLEPRLRAHIDNVYYVSPTRQIEDATTICVVEEKNAAEIHDDPLDDYEAQLQYQLGLLQMNYPAARKSGFLYQTDLDGEHTEYDGRIELYMDEAEKLFLRGQQLLAWIDAKQVPDPDPSMKCSWCPYRGSCSKWQEETPFPEDVLEQVRRYSSINAQVKELCEEKKQVKERITHFLKEAGHKRFRGEVTAGFYVNLYEMKGKESVKASELRSKHPQVADEMIKKGASSTVLKIEFKPEEEAAA